MRYWKLYWHHGFPAEPVAIYSEIGPDDGETRRVEEFRGGRTGWADERRTHGGVFLADVPFGDVSDVSDAEEGNGPSAFTVFVIDREEFDAVWKRATGGAA
ncbi:DUF6881 domain-containing protein [Streptomyces avicenniae]|uniref:DUF6881 domain-containing protein n=1 Tax=Streptomyces avicenniae TaxID=500153 RepID=UPI00069A289D|nr:hypothetical protein [Streptomyces avicenniae]